MSLRILEIYGHATFQGAPQDGVRRFGVPPGGAFDQESLAFANTLLGNDRHALAIELASGAIRFECIHSARFAVVGAECPVFIDDRNAPCQASFALLPGQVVNIKSPISGARAYIAFPSPARNYQAGQAASKGLTLESSKNETTSIRLRVLDKPPSTFRVDRVRVMPFQDEQLPAGHARVSKSLDRVGIRLENVRAEPGEEKLSEPACSGTIQVSNDGGLIILGPDGPTIGGYKKIGVVCSADLNKLGQLTSGQKIFLEPISREDAIQAWSDYQMEFEARLRDLASTLTD